MALHEKNRFLIRFTFPTPFLSPLPLEPAGSFLALQLLWLLEHRFRLRPSPRAKEAARTSFRDVRGRDPDPDGVRSRRLAA